VCQGPYNTGLTLHSPHVNRICVRGRVGGLVGEWLVGRWFGRWVCDFVGGLVGVCFVLASLFVSFVNLCCGVCAFMSVRAWVGG